MTATLSNIRTDVRRELKDEDSGAYRWTDNEIDRHIRRALVEYSRVSPREMKSTIATTASSRTMSIASAVGDDLIKALAVEYPVDKFPIEYQRFRLWNNIITFVGDVVPDGSNCYLYWGSVHALADSGTPTTSIPEKDQETVVAGAAAYAAVAWAQNAVNRVNLGGKGTGAEFLRWGLARHRDFLEELGRFRSKLRTGRMYAPQDPTIQSQTRDFGP